MCVCVCVCVRSLPCMYHPLLLCKGRSAFVTLKEAYDHPRAFMHLSANVDPVRVSPSAFVCFPLIGRARGAASGGRRCAGRNEFSAVR